MGARYLWAGIICLLSMAVPASAAPESAVHCKDVVSKFDRLICEHPDLQEARAQIARENDGLRRHYTGEARRIFDVEYKRWREYSTGCAGRDGGLWDKGGPYGCLKRFMDQRLAYLQSLKDAPWTIQDAVAAYPNVEPWYLNALAKQYEGKTVDLLGTFTVATCDVPEIPHSAHVVLHGSSVEFRFDRITIYEWQRLCKGPFAGWLGTVMLDRGRPYLYVPEPPL